MAVFDAIEAGNVERVRELVRDDPSAATVRDEHGLSPLLHAKYNAKDDLVPILREAVPALDFFEACAVGEAARVAELVDADPALVHALAPDGFTGLTLAAFFAHADVVRVLLDRGADPNLRARHEHIQVMPIHAAAAGNDTEVVRLLVDAGAELDTTQPGGFTALMSAAQNGNAAAVDLLLERGADGGLAREDGKTAADFARHAGHADIAARLDE